MIKINKKKIALIHVAKAKLGLTDIEYRDMLADICGVESAKDITAAAFERLMVFLKSIGFSSPGHKLHNLTRAQEYRIKELEKALGWSNNPKRLQGFCRKITKKEIDEISKYQCGNLIAALERTLRYQSETGNK